MSLLNLYEMSRARGDAMWAVLDWAAQQPGDFTYQDLYKIFQAAGGGSTMQQFHSMVKVAKPWKDDQAKYGVSEKRPFVFSKRGNRGKGGAAQLSWGLEGPLRTAQPMPTPKSEDEPEDEMGEILDQLETKIGRPALKAMLQRWRNMTDVSKIYSDVNRDSTIPARFKNAAYHVAISHLVGKGQQKPSAGVDLGPEKNDTPFTTPPKPKAQAPKPQAAPEPEDDDEDMGDGWETVPNGTSGDLAQNSTDGEEEPEQDDSEMELDPGIDVFDNEPSDEEGEDDLKDREYPVYLPDPDDEGDMYEEAMFRIVSETDPVIDEFDPIWEQLKNSQDQDDAREIIRKSRIPKHLQPAAVRVAKAIYDNTGRDWEGKPKGKRESKLLSLYREGPLAEPVDFNQESGLARIYNVDEAKGDAVVGGWEEAERYWPGCSTAWDEIQLAGEPAEVEELWQAGPLLFAEIANNEKYMYVPKEQKWAAIGSMAVESSAGWVKIQGPGGTLYIPRGKNIPRIELIGPQPQDIPGFTAPEKRNGKVSATKQNPNAEDIRQAALAITAGDGPETD